MCDQHNGQALIFIEPRVLGRVYLVDEANLPPVLNGLKEMGLEPISPEFNAGYLRRKVGSRKASIKALLLDQSITAGIGNIYSDEALFRAGIRPLRRAGRLGKVEVERLAQALTNVLRDGIRWCGTTLSDGRYRLPEGGAGSFQKRLAVFGREGERCRRRGCEGVVRRLRVGGRSTHFCPVCQK